MANAILISVFYVIIFANCIASQLEVDLNLNKTGKKDKENKTKPPLAFTESGWVQGYFQKTSLGRRISAFDGIRYAQPPEGQLRFKDPIPNRPWTGIYQATRKSPACLQLDFASFLRVHGREDCLFLNVYTPITSLPRDRNHTEGLPVLIFIHGGGYSWGRSSDTGPAYLLNSDVILVTINFRLGILGFLSTGDEHASGNWGMKDQVLAIKWVAANINYFGGDPNRITLFGNSAGGAGVGLHMVSKQSKHLFHRSIIQSGSPFANWAIQNDTFENSRIVADMMGCLTSNSKAMVSCLRKADANWIVGRSISTWKIFVVSRLPFGPTIEPHSPTAFLEEAPEVSYRQGRVAPIPMCVGITKDEGAVLAEAIYLFPGYLRRLNNNWNRWIPYVLAFDKRTNDVNNVANKLKHFYVDGEKMTFWNRRHWMKMFGDRMIVQGVHTLMQQHSSIAPTFGYVFNYLGTSSFTETLGLNRHDWGVAHTDELIYLMNNTNLFPPLTIGGKDSKVSDYLVNLWTTFAATGKPTLGRLDWTPISDIEDMNVLEINESPRMIKFPREIVKRAAFWKNLKLKDDVYF